jgi:hypothetical protein
VPQRSVTHVPYVGSARAETPSVAGGTTRLRRGLRRPHRRASRRSNHHRRVARLDLVEGVGPPDNPFEVGPTRMRGWIEQVRVARARGKGRPTLSPDDALRRMAANHPSVDPAVLAHRLPHLAADTGEGRVAWHFDPMQRTTAPMPFFAKAVHRVREEGHVPGPVRDGRRAGVITRPTRRSASPRSRTASTSISRRRVKWRTGRSPSPSRHSFSSTSTREPRTRARGMTPSSSEARSLTGSTT